MLEVPIEDMLTPNTEDLELTYKKEVLKDFWICCVSREASIMGRREVLNGKGKFGIVGDGKEVPQVAMARAFKKGDWRSGYYRDQTFMFAMGLSSVEEFFAQIYADSENDSASGGRQMNSHYATAVIDDDGEWLDQTDLFNVSADVSSTAGQMARAVGLALASKKYRQSSELNNNSNFSKNGNEVCFCTIGDASTTEGIFWESVNAAAVQHIPMLISVWDDGYGISVPKKFQTTKASISELLQGFKLNDKNEGLDIYEEKCWNYPALCELYENSVKKVRETHVPALVHIEECTQQLGHSTSGSHERYKSKDRLAWEKEFDCIEVMANWMVQSEIASDEEIQSMKSRAKKYVRECKDKAWEKYKAPIRKEKQKLESIYETVLKSTALNNEVTLLRQEIHQNPFLIYSDLVRNARQLFFLVRKEKPAGIDELENFITLAGSIAHKRYHTNLYSSSKYAALNVPVVPPVYSEDSVQKNGYEVLNIFFDKALEKHKNLFAFGEDVGIIGGVNQSFMGLQEKYGMERVFDTGIREWSIVGQAIGMALRGLRPIAEIQYLDYLVYGIVPMTDDLSTLRYRSNNQQQAPAIIRTRGHRLEGIWHSGSPIGMIVNSIRGMYLLVPRNFVQAAGMYNTLLNSDDPALVIECLNGYRLKERVPDNIGEYTVPLGVPEILTEGTDVTLVTYGSCVRVAAEGVRQLAAHGISVELIDVQTLLPFDLENRIVASLSKTNRIVFMDEDVPGGGSAFMMREVLEVQKGYRFLDSPPLTITAKEHRTPFGSDGDYFSKPNSEDVFESIFDLMQEAEPTRF